jgi:hypothetical protein
LTILYNNNNKAFNPKYELTILYTGKLQTKRDGSLMTLAQSKKMSQLTQDNAQWEDRQLLRSGAVRGTEVQTEFDDEDERKVILLVHGACYIYVLTGWIHVSTD